jgi:hypothetical protein
MTHETQADAICEVGHKAGLAIVATIDDAYSILPARRLRRIFDGMVESLTDDMSGTEAALFIASAYEAIPAVMLSAVERAEISSNAWRAYEVFLGDAREAEAEAIADFRADQRRDEVAA